MKVSLECTSLAALAAALADRMLKHAEMGTEMSVEDGDAAAAKRWTVLARTLRRPGTGEIEAALETALDCLLVEQETLSPCPKCGGQRDRDPSGGIYCTECR